MHSLMERMDRHYTKTEADLLTEEISETRPDARNRTPIEPEKLQPVLQQRMTGGMGVKSSITYLCQQSLKLPHTLGNRIDYSPLNELFGIQERIKGVLRLSRYTFNWRSEKSISGLNDKFVASVNQIKDRFNQDYGLNLTPIQQQRKPNNGIMGMAVMNDTLQDKIYKFLQNTGGPDCTEVAYYFIVGNGGKILPPASFATSGREYLSKDELEGFFKDKWETGAPELRDQGADYATIQKYNKELASLKIDLKTFLLPSIVSIMTTYQEDANTPPQKMKYYNEGMSTVIGESNIPIDPAYFINFVKKVYRDV